MALAKKKKPTAGIDPIIIKPTTIFIDENMHAKMKEIAARTRQQIGPVYEDAIRVYIGQTKNYTGSKK